MRIEKKYKHQTGGYGGCLWMIIAVILVSIAMSCMSCATTKRDGCGTENYKHKFNK